MAEVIALGAMSSTVSYTPALLLSNDLWAHVLSLVAGEVHADIVACSLEPHVDVSSAYSLFHGLRLVCTRFRAIFRDNPQLSACVFLGTAFSAEAFMSLLGQLQRGNTQMEVLVAICDTPYVEATLAAGSIAANKPLLGLKAIILHSPMAAWMLALCTNLTTCCLGHQDDLDLEPLQALPSLSDLRLHQVSSVRGVDKLAYLTRVDLGWTHAECGGHTAFVAGLKMLSVRHSLVEGLHGRGISACSGLRHLVLQDCCVYANTDLYVLNIKPPIWFNDPPLAFPMHISDLTQLTNLDIFGTLNTAVVCPWLFALTNLVSLQLHFCAEAYMHNLKGCFSDLCALEHFDISIGAPQGALLTLEVSWHLMPLLQSIQIEVSRVRFDTKVLGLIKLRNLKSIDLNFTPDDKDTSFYMGMLIYNMAARCPQVEFRLGAVLPHKLMIEFDESL